MGDVLRFRLPGSRGRRSQVLVKPLEGAEPRVLDVAVDELREPGVTDAGLFGDPKPITLALHQGGANLLVEGDVFHAHRIAISCYESKQPIATPGGHSPRMDITTILAANLRHFMGTKKMTQQTLANASGLGQTTISLYLRPERRNATNKGGAPSPTLAKVQALADALEVELWELVRPLSQAQRDLIRSVDAVIAEKTEAPAPAKPASTKEGNITARQISPNKAARKRRAG